MQEIGEIMLQDREHAGRLLGEKLVFYKGSDAVVAGIPNGGMVVAAAIADFLSLPLTAWPCRRIVHPADNNKSIGSVCANDIYVRHHPRTIPQDYIYHQIAMLRSAIQSDYKQFNGVSTWNSLRDKVVILVDDVVGSSDSIMACLRGIRKLEPARIIVAAPVITPEAARSLSMHCDDVLFLYTDPVISSGHDYFGDFRRIGHDEVRKLLASSSPLVKLN